MIRSRSILNFAASFRGFVLSWETNKELLLKHIVAHTRTGSRLQELMQVLPMLSKDQVQKLVKELKLRRTIFNKRTTRSALWYPVSIAPK